jgi:ribosomal protein S16
MAVKIRMKRIGAKNAPVFRIVVADGRSPRDGKFIEEIGTYHPRQKVDNVKVDLERVKYWLGQGAQPSDTVASFIKGLVQNTEAVSVTLVAREGTTIYELRLDAQDVGKIIGRQGQTINAVRSLLLAGSAKKGLRCSVEIVEDRR